LKELISHEQVTERALLVVVDFDDNDRDWLIDDEREEFSALVESTGIEIIEEMLVPRAKIDATYFIGSGKSEEIAAKVKETNADVVIFNKDLSPHHTRNLEEIMVTAKVIDRTQLILDIFAKHASSDVGKLQVELAQLEYAMPRLTGMHSGMMRQKGGIGMRGPGETKLEVDRRRLQERISYIKGQIEDVRTHRELLRTKRRKDDRPYVALVGYTSAGKTSLLNALTGTVKETHADYFTTLDTVTRETKLGDKDEVLIADTVGFVHQLPQKLVEAFASTLEELNEADLMLHVVDISNPHYKKMQKAVEDILLQLHLNEKPTLMVYNKIDKLDEFAVGMLDYWHPTNSVFVAAKTGLNLEKLCEIIRRRTQTSMTVEVTISADCHDALNFIYRNSSVISCDAEETSIKFGLSIKRTLWAEFLSKFENVASDVTVIEC